MLNVYFYIFSLIDQERNSSSYILKQKLEGAFVVNKNARSKVMKAAGKIFAEEWNISVKDKI